MTGAGNAVTVKFWPPPVPPAVVTLTARTPGVANCDSAKFAVSAVPLTTETLLTTTSGSPLTETVVPPAMKFVPDSETATCEPCTPDAGVIDVNVGGGGRTVNDPGEVTPPAVETVTSCAPSTAFAATTNVAVSDVEFTTLMFETAIPEPLVVIVVAPGTKFVPTRVTARAVPCTPEPGVMLENVGGGGLTVKESAALVPPVVVTLTLCAPSVADAATATMVVSDVVPVTAVFETEIPAPAIATLVAPVTNPVPERVTATLVP